MQKKLNNTPLVSVVIPVYNTGHYVCHILESIKKQTYKNIELIVVDDGSTDNSVSVIEHTMVNSDVKWTLLRLENGGVSRARNKGIEISNGDWIFCPDSDDGVNPRAIEYMLQSAIANDTQCAFCEYKNVSENAIDERIHYDDGIEVLTQEELKYHNMLRKTNVIVPGMVISRDVFSKIRFDEQCPYSEDTLYIWELIYQIKKAVWVKCDLYNYFVREGSKQHSLTMEKCIAAIERYKVVTSNLVISYPDDIIAKTIQPKFILASMHVLARCNGYKEFLSVYKKTDKTGISLLFKLKDIKLSVFSILYKFAPYLFYRIAIIR